MKDRKPLNNKIFTAQGKNGLNAIAYYKFRKFYKDKYLQIDKPFEKSLIDFWYQKPFFGKVDTGGNAIFISETNLKQLRVEGDDTIFAVDFVADAFNDLQMHFTEAAFQRKIMKEGSSYASLNPQIAWAPVNTIYHNYLTAIYKSFVKNYITSRGVERRIGNFGDFVHMFTLFLRDVGIDFPFTRTGYILSNRCPNTICGLMIDLAGTSHGTDLKKVNSYIKDRNFEFFRESAKNFGFMVDRNAPWRLVADLSSPKMKEYISRYGFWSSTDEMVEKYYYKSYLLDIQMMKAYMVEFYNSFAMDIPYTDCAGMIETRGEVGAVGFQERIAKKRIFRQKVTREQVDELYGPAFWLQTYLFIRMYESGASATWTPQRFKNKIKKVFDFYKVFDFDTALGYINDWAKDEMKLNLAKMLATATAGGLLASDIQKVQDQDPVTVTVPSVEDVVSSYQKTEEKPHESNVGYSKIYDPDEFN